MTRPESAEGGSTPSRTHIHRVAVVNASPLIYLARSGLITLLRLAGDVVVVPDNVVREIRARGDHDPTAAALKETSWIQEFESPSVPAEVVAWNLGPGESSVIAWALLNEGCAVVIDDLQGRRCAELLGLRLRGTLGLVLRAKTNGEIESARVVLERLRSAGMYLSRRVADAALAEIGE